MGEKDMFFCCKKRLVIILRLIVVLSEYSPLAVGQVAQIIDFYIFLYNDKNSNDFQQKFFLSVGDKI